MKHPVSKSDLLLYVSDELSATDRNRVERHLRNCSVCRKETSDLKRFNAFIAHHSPVPRVDAAFSSLRNQVMRSIRNEAPAASRAARIRSLLGLADGVTLRPVVTLAVIVVLTTLAVRFFSPTGQSGLSGLTEAAYDPYRPQSEKPGRSNGDAQILNVQILSKDEESGDIEFEFEALVRSRVEGNMNDPAVQNILAKALVSSQNPAVRLRAVNAFSLAAADNSIADPSRELVKNSLISALLHDENHGVRLEALKALSEFMPDSAATSAVIRVLTTDKNSAMKIAAINTLDLTKYREGATRNRLSQVLFERSLNDENNYIRIKAKAALQEVEP